MKILSIVRDLVIILGVGVICWVLISAERAADHARRVRLHQTSDAIKQLEAVYKSAVFDSSENKGIYQQIFRQNEIAIEYQKLSLLRDLAPTSGINPDAAPEAPKPRKR